MEPGGAGRGRGPDASSGSLRRLDGLDALRPAAFRRPVATIGVFDGLHRGHRHVIEHLVSLAERLDGEPVVITFDTHPRGLLEGRAPELILSVPHRLLLLERLGVEAAVVLPFDDAMRRTDHETFTREILVERLGIVGLLFGFDGAFGHGGRGTYETVAPLGARLGFVVAQAPPITMQHEAISATRIREAIREGDLAAAEAMLGRPPALYGRVVRGDGRGRTLGFPTANLDPEGEILPPHGVYQVVVGWRGTRYAAIANVGVRPTFRSDADAESRPLVEVHIPGEELDLYDERIEVELVRRIRAERTFPSREALVRQIRADVASLGLEPPDEPAAPGGKP